MEKKITRGKAIRLKCLDCCCGSAVEVRRCSSTACPLWPYRLYGTVAAKTPQKTGVFSENNAGV